MTNKEILIRNMENYHNARDLESLIVATLKSHMPKAADVSEHSFESTAYAISWNICQEYKLERK